MTIPEYADFITRFLVHEADGFTGMTYADAYYFETLRGEMTYDKWFYGHLHDNRRVMDNHYLLYEQIIRI